MLGNTLGRSILSALHKTLEAEDWGLCCMSPAVPTAES